MYMAQTFENLCQSARPEVWRAPGVADVDRIRESDQVVPVLHVHAW